MNTLFSESTFIMAANRDRKTTGIEIDFMRRRRIDVGHVVYAVSRNDMQKFATCANSASDYCVTKYLFNSANILSDMFILWIHVYI